MKNKMKKTKRFLGMVIISGSLILGNTAYAANLNDIEESVKIEKDDAVQLRYGSYERVIWYYRIVNGREQKRLWSITAGEWLTKWQWA